VLGGVSSATILYGMSFLYGVTGSTNMGIIQQTLYQNISSFPALVYVAFFLIIAGMGFKIAAVPFHTWVPDVYKGASTPVTAFLAVISKVAAFAMTFRFVYAVFFGIADGETHPLEGDMYLTLAVLAAATMIVGNVLALRQTNLKRLFAYSGIANSGYLLVPPALGFALVHYVNFAEFYFYMVAYLFMNIGAFALIMMVERTSGNSEMSGLAGMYYRSPATAVAVVLLVLSLAGFPVTGGFFGKLFIILGAMETHKYWLGAVMIGASVISYAYYFGLIRQMFMRTEIDSKPVYGTVLQRVVLWVCAIVGVVMGFAPQWLLDYIDKIFTIGTDLFAS
jgi:NADH-quinone oxidoreductase subunit N